MLVKQLYPAFESQRKLPVNYESMFAGKEDFIHTSEQFPAIHLCKEENAWVSPYGVVFNHLKVIDESVYGMFKPSSYTKSFFKKILFGKNEKINDTCIVAHNAYYENYYHFLLEIMPRIYLSQREVKDAVLLMHEKQPKYVQDYLKLFQFKSIVPIKQDGLVKAKEVYFTSPIARPLAYHDELLKEFAGWLRTKLFDEKTDVPSPEKIFISRKNARYRISINEEKIQAYLEENGFVAVAPENYSVKEQANLFKNAKIIIGSHGAGFSNFIFSDKCKLIIDIIHQQHPQDCFYNEAAVFNVDYYYFQCEGAGIHTYKNNDDVIIDVDRFIHEIKPYLN